MKMIYHDNKMLRQKTFPAMIMLVTVVLLSVYLIAEAEAEAKPVKMIPESFSTLAEKVSPAVVNIRTVKLIQGGGRVFRQFKMPFEKDDPMGEFFEKFFGQEPQRKFKQRSLGSGFIIDHEGFIVTNNHVVESADQIKVILSDGKEFGAEIVGRDPNTDLALIKIRSKKNLPVVALGNSDTLKVGEWVVAIGSPFGLEHTLTAGIVSAKGRVIGSGPYDDFIQTDASINPGNSGGPLINMKGQVVGINTAIIASGQGIGFAIPINLARGVIEQLKEKGEVTRGWLGVGIQDLNKELAEYYGLEKKSGVLVMEVFPGDPADTSGIKAQDIILEVNGMPVKTSRDLTRIIAGIKVGQTASIKIYRKGNERIIQVKIAKRKDRKIYSKRKPEKSYEEELGIRVKSLTPKISRQLNLADTSGVIVSAIKPDGKSAAAGVKVGDIITEINHKAIRTVDDFVRAIEKVGKGETIQIFIKRMKVGFLVAKIAK